MTNITTEDLYLTIFKKCRFIAKPNEWFVEGTEAKMLRIEFSPNFDNTNKFNDSMGLFEGLTNEPHDDEYEEKLPRLDAVTCTLDEFYIYDEFDNELSNLTFDEYQQLVNKHEKEK
jgi:hypothetical protein